MSAGDCLLIKRPAFPCLALVYWTHCITSTKSKYKSVKAREKGQCGIAKEGVRASVVEEHDEQYSM